MSENSALVQHIATTDRWSAPDSYQALLKREHAAEFLAAELLYGAIDEREKPDKLNRLQSCRTNAWFIRHDLTGEVRIASNSCKLRWCPLCAQARQNYITSQVSAWFRQVDHPKLLTLTLRHTSSPLINQVNFLYHCWQKLRKRKFVKSRMRGGVWFFQVKKSKDGETWHPHLHVLIDSDFIARKKLSQIWAEITKGSDVIDIRAIIDTDKAVQHNARYCATPGTLVDLLPWEAMDLYETFAKRRLVGCFGTAKEISLRPCKPPDSASWISVGSWSLIVGLAGEDSRADNILEAWRNNRPLESGNSLLELEHEVAGRAPPDDQVLLHEQYCLDFYTKA